MRACRKAGGANASALFRRLRVGLASARQDAAGSGNHSGGSGQAQDVAARNAAAQRGFDQPIVHIFKLKN
jgi:hypothetical protein